MDVLLQMIGSYGFPICMCLLMYKSMNENTERHEKAMKDLNNKHKEETSELTEAINNNTNVMNLLIEKLNA